ncbi:Ribonuclease/ribotoxin [Amylostereum chailletii]|nr:Ribonuclease/ribotoxin [Amylostereum chailletii]
MFIQTLVLLASAVASFASPIESRAWPSGTVTCGSHSYSVSAVKAAVSQGYSLINDPVGSSAFFLLSVPRDRELTPRSCAPTDSYPHKYNNYEGLELYCTGEKSYEEFPILSSGSLYTGGSPGADRVVFSTNGVYCAVVTHTGASGNNFVSCNGD